LKYIKHSSNDVKEYLGPDALENFVSDVKKSGVIIFEENTIMMNEFLYITSSFYYLVFRIEELHTKLNNTDKSIMLQKIQFMYHARFDENLTVLVNYAYHSTNQKFKKWGIALNDMNREMRTLFKVLDIYLK
jgi:acyl-homoserine lactone acylase PvdQ